MALETFPNRTPGRNYRRGDDALRKKGAPPLAILDWMMPGMDGVEICRRLREVDRVLYIILLTARGSKENVVEGLGAGADDYLIKPFDKMSCTRASWSACGSWACKRHSRSGSKNSNGPARRSRSGGPSRSPASLRGSP